MNPFKNHKHVYTFILFIYLFITYKGIQKDLKPILGDF